MSIAEGTLVATPDGPVAIEKLKVGDQVIGFDSVQPALCGVHSVHKLGSQSVTPFVGGEKPAIFAATEAHKFLVCRSMYLRYRDFDIEASPYVLLATDKITPEHRFLSVHAPKAIRNEDGEAISLTLSDSWIEPYNSARSESYLAKIYDISVDIGSNMYCLYRGGIVTQGYIAI